jgi:hypothetical protein
MVGLVLPELATRLNLQIWSVHYDTARGPAAAARDERSSRT